jgi:hypothetical protein
MPWLLTSPYSHWKDKVERRPGWSTRTRAEWAKVSKEQRQPGLCECHVVELHFKWKTTIQRDWRSAKRVCLVSTTASKHYHHQLSTEIKPELFKNCFFIQAFFPHRTLTNLTLAADDKQAFMVIFLRLSQLHSILRVFKDRDPALGGHHEILSAVSHFWFCTARYMLILWCLHLIG